jgi:hypothetical protein
LPGDGDGGREPGYLLCQVGGLSQVTGLPANRRFCGFQASSQPAGPLADLGQPGGQQGRPVKVVMSSRTAARSSAARAVAMVTGRSRSAG